MKKEIAVKQNNKGTTHIEVKTYYSLGGMNYATYKTDPRGYWLSVKPIERRPLEGGGFMIGFTCFSGYRQLLKEVSRKSKKAEAEADKIAVDYENAMIERVLLENGLELETA